MTRFEIEGEDEYGFVEPEEAIEREPGVFTTAPTDVVAGDLYVEQLGSKAQMYAAVGPDEYDPERELQWVPLSTETVGPDGYNSGIQLWMPDTLYNFPDIVITGETATGFMLWIATAEVEATTDEPGTVSSPWVSLGGNTAGLKILGSVPEPDDLPATGNTLGDLYYVVSDGALYSWGSDDAWHNVGYIVGPAGPPGNDGAEGPAGPTGADGPPGPQGPAGTGIDLNGAVDTAADLPAVAPPGTAYMVSDTGVLAVYGSDDAWHDVPMVVGPTGPEGPQGDDGPAGPVTPMEIVEGLDIPPGLPDGALFFDLDALGPVEDHEARIDALEVEVDDHEARITTNETSAEANTTAIAGHETRLDTIEATPHVTSLAGTASEVEVSAASGAVTVGLPNTVAVTTELTVAGESMPRGYVTHDTVTTPPAAFTTETDMPLSVTWTAIAGRKYLVTLTANLNSTVAGDQLGMYITTSANAHVAEAYVGGSGTNLLRGLMCMAVVTPGAGTAYYKVRASRNAGSGTCTFAVGTTRPGILLVEDIGT